MPKIASSHGLAPPGVFINGTHEPSVRTNQPINQIAGAANMDGLDPNGRADLAMPVQRHINPKATIPPDLMAIDQEKASTNSD